MKAIVLTCLLASSALAQEQFLYTANNGVVTITGYTGTNANVVIPSAIGGLSVAAIGYEAFYRSTIASVIIPESVTYIGPEAFQASSLQAVTIGNGVTDIEPGAFSYSGLTNIILPDNVTNVAAFAFASCSNLTGAALGAGISSLNSADDTRNTVFAGSFRLKTITVDSRNSTFSSVDSVLFSKDGTTLAAYPGGKVGFYRVPDNVLQIGAGAFMQCTNLSAIALPNGVTNIEQEAFRDCVNLTSIVVPASVKSVAGAFMYSSLNSVYFLGNAPRFDSLTFYGPSSAIVYYMPGTTGWSSTFGGRIALLWNPQASAPVNSTNGFGFAITGTSGLTVVVEATADLAKSVWQPISTNTLTGGSSTFSDPAWTSYPARWYRFRSL